MQGARPIYIYRLAPCTENCSQRIYKTFSIKYLEHVHIFSTFEPKKYKSVFQTAVSTCTLKILCCGYNLATQKRRKFINNYDTRRCKEYSFSSLSANKGVNQQVMRFAPLLHPKIGQDKVAGQSPKRAVVSFLFACTKLHPRRYVYWIVLQFDIVYFTQCGYTDKQAFHCTTSSHIIHPMYIVTI